MEISSLVSLFDYCLYGSKTCNIYVNRDEFRIDVFKIYMGLFYITPIVFTYFERDTNVKLLFVVVQKVAFRNYLECE